MLVGYARVSTVEQTLALQEDALSAADCERLLDASERRRPVLAGKAVRPGPPVPDATSGVCPAARRPGRHGRERPSGWSFRPAQIVQNSGCPDAAGASPVLHASDLPGAEALTARVESVSHPLA